MGPARLTGRTLLQLAHPSTARTKLAALSRPLGLKARAASLTQILTRLRGGAAARDACSPPRPARPSGRRRLPLRPRPAATASPLLPANFFQGFPLPLRRRSRPGHLVHTGPVRSFQTCPARGKVEVRGERQLCTWRLQVGTAVACSNRCNISNQTKSRSDSPSESVAPPPLVTLQTTSRASSRTSKGTTAPTGSTCRMDSIAGFH